MPSEAEYLAVQATRAKARMRESVTRLVDEVLAPLNVRPFIRRRPWWCLGGSVLGGYLFGRSLRRRPGHMATGSGKIRDMVAGVSRRVRHAIRSALGAMALASLRGQARNPDVQPSVEPTVPQEASAAN
jgi:hypothetical protein